MATNKTHKANDDKPKDLKFNDLVVDISFHPGRDVIAAGHIGGDVTIHTYSTTGENNELMTLEHHKKACRALRFSKDGIHLYTASKDKSIQVVDLNTGSVKQKIKAAHSSPIYCLQVTGENFLASGDDDGHIKLWDLRTKTAVMDMKENEDYISDMAIDDQQKMLLASSGDGTLTAFNVRRKRMELQSELFDSELLSLSIVKGNQKVLCGTSEGVVNIFNWGEWGNISDRFPGHPMSIDCMVPITKDIVCTGSSDGIVRAVHILPNRFLGVVGEHDEFPIENLSLSHDKIFLASCSHDQTVKFWKVDNLKREKVNTRKKAKKTNKPKYLAPKDDFFAGLAEGEPKDNEKNEDSDEDDDNDDDDDDDDE
ncbi:WD repeat-containing protein 55-like isoform X2 [Ostrea edulis]|uniref:WD repeat-containing protein 55-like isoform X2 n=1 Tax=Ostrea edulis TaxID=37623 RepID=UPI0024AFB874|nr:WD repeat-containing protein 55-like isoform X2 [Ostrea edulis]